MPSLAPPDRQRDEDVDRRRATPSPTLERDGMDQWSQQAYISVGIGGDQANDFALDAGALYVY